jgi:hypothetical protein
MLMPAAKSGSIAARINTWVLVKLYHLIKNGASAENIPQIAKPSANATVEIHKTFGLPDGSAAGTLAPKAESFTVAPDQRDRPCTKFQAPLRLHVVEWLSESYDK